MYPNLFTLVSENKRLQRELVESRKALRALKIQYAALEEDFLHALDCEHKEICPKAEIRKQVTIADWPETHKRLRDS
ncbi:hypothetical protein [Thiomicrorhabdus heinhorstiae]|uniref:Uncharacterized protein n=1 Tax=Thiomicrorhabdus heinhorstiae TaxID=2748010 RepID=A0ABS0BYQ9_9GAMM|nr:hypothetical protein [Thiomicrorhabdus heinhorstiae]MBF6058124.1 hypothetical protein [Thiomicrorhabdus heinhorstiae]